MGILMPNEELTQAQPEAQTPEAQPQQQGVAPDAFDQMLAQRKSSAPAGAPKDAFDQMLAQRNSAPATQASQPTANQPEPSGFEGVSGFEAGATPETGYQPGPLDKGVIGGMTERATEQAKGAVAEGITPFGYTAAKQAYSQLKELPSQYRAYEAARQKGLPPAQAMEVVQEELSKKSNALKSLQQRVKELTSADSEVSARAIGKSIVDLLPIVLGITEMIPESAAVKASTSAATLEAQAAKTAEQVATHRYNPSTKTVEPIQQAAQQGVEKVANRVGGLPEGKTASVAPTEETIQPALEGGMHEVSEAAAKESGVPYTKGADVRDSVGTTARATKASASADYKTLDTASEGRWQRFDDKIENINNEISEKVGIDDERVVDLETRRAEIMASQDKMLDEMVKAGKVDPNIADRARQYYKQSMAQHDVSNAIRGATKKQPVGGKSVDVTDPNALINRLQKLNDIPPSGGPSRLVQALGEKGAKQIMEHAENAQIAKAAIKDFVPTTSTGKVALHDILEKHTKPGLGIGAKGKVDWKGSLEDFEKLEPAERTKMFGNDVSGVREALTHNARIQSAIAWMLKYGGIVAAGAAGADILKSVL